MFIIIIYYNGRHNHLFWTDSLNDSVFIWQSNLDDGSEARPIINSGANSTQYGKHNNCIQGIIIIASKIDDMHKCHLLLVGIAVDWISDKIFWTKINQIMVYDLQQGYQTTVIDAAEPDALFHQVVADPNTR